MAKPDVLALFKTVARYVDKRSFDNVTRESVIALLNDDSASLLQIVGEMETRLGILVPDEELVEVLTVGNLCDVIAAHVDG